MRIKKTYYQPLILFGILWAFFLTVLRALRWPNDWAEAHWLISYEFGFIKRALLGTLLAPFTNFGNINAHANLVVNIASIAFFVLFCAGLLWMCFRILKNSTYDIYSVLAVLVFLTSPYIVMSAHLNGYFDNIIIIITIVACLSVLQKNIWLASIFISSGLLVHESIILIGLPSVIFISLIQHANEIDSSDPKQLFIVYLSRYKILFLIPMLTFFSMFTYQVYFQESVIIRDQLITHLSQFDFIQNDRSIFVPIALTTHFTDYLISQSQYFFYRITTPSYVIKIGLPLFILIFFSWKCLRLVAYNKLIISAFVAITLLPLSIHIIAGDTSRIWTYPLVVAVIAVWGIIEIYNPISIRRNAPHFFIVTALLVIGYQIFTSIPLMDGELERYSDKERILLYAPSLVLIIIFVAKYYYRLLMRPPPVNEHE